MLAGIEDVYSDSSYDYLSYDEALEVSFESVVEHTSKASQEHFGEDRKSTRLNSSHSGESRMPSSA